MSIIMSKALLKTKPRYPRNPEKIATLPVLVSVDRAGDLKLGTRKCRLHKKEDVMKVAKNYGVPSVAKKTVKQLCSSIKRKAKMSNDGKVNIPLAKLYPEAAKKRTACPCTKQKKSSPCMKTAIKKMVVKKGIKNFMNSMVTRNSNIAKLRQLNIKPKPSKKAQPITKEEARKRIEAMKGLTRNVKSMLTYRVDNGPMSPRRVVKVARELSRLNVPSYRVVL